MPSMMEIPARIVRVGRAVYISGARVSIFGGVQPKVFKTFFGGEDGLYLSDGTFFRFLATCEPPTYYDLTPESWGERDRDKWETLLHRAMDWVDGKICAYGGRIEKPTRMIFDSEAQGKFFEWRNQLYSCKDRLPAQLRGFLPKAVEYVLRLTGVIHVIQMFSIGSTPKAILSVEDLERGIKTVSFYLGQIQGALRLIEERRLCPAGNLRAVPVAGPNPGPVAAPPGKWAPVHWIHSQAVQHDCPQDPKDRQAARDGGGAPSRKSDHFSGQT